MFIIVLGRHVSILIESFLGPSNKIDPYLKFLKCAVGSQTRHMHFIHSCIKNVSIWDLTVHFKHFK